MPTRQARGAQPPSVAHERWHIAGEPMTLDQFMATPEGAGYTYVDGRCFREPPLPAHQFAAFNVARLLDAHVRPAGTGRVVQGLGVRLGEHVLVPDVCFVSHARARRFERQWLRGVAPELCVEVLSPGTARLDRGRKADLYGQHGCLEYWLVDTWVRRIEVRRAQSEGRLTLAGRFDAGDTFGSCALPGLTVDVAEVFRDV